MIDVPRYRHEVSLDFVRVELALQYTFAQGWDALLRVPYEVKTQHVSFHQLGPVTLPQLLAQQRHTYVHHRSETYQGPSDLMLLVARRWQDLLVAGDGLVLAWGVTLPTGQTERDPFVRGDRGQEHLHIQFGTGTVDPLLEVSYQAPLPEGFHLGAFAAGRFPCYENRKTYRGAPEVTAGLRLGRALTDWLELNGELTHFAQGFAHWDGHRDENSGLLSLLVGVGVTLRPGGGLSFDLGARYPVAQRSLSDDGDTFTQGPSFLLSAAWTW